MSLAEKTKYFLIKHGVLLLVALFYAATAFFVQYPLLQNISRSLVPGDGLFTYWTISWNLHSILHDPANLFNANIFFPNQNTLAYSEGLFAPTLIVLPIYLMVRNMIVAYNLMIILSYFLAAFGAYKLAKYYTKNEYAAFIAGIIFGFATFRIASGHFQNLMIFWMPFAAIYLQKYLDAGKRKYMAYFALLFSAQMLSCWNMGAFFTFFVAYILIANYKTIRKNFSSFLKDGLIALAIMAALIGPFAYPSFKLHYETGFSWTIEDMINGSADIGGYVLPIPGSPESRLTSFLGITKEHWAENWNFLGYFPLLLLAWYFLFSKNKIGDKNFKIYFWGIPLFTILSFGPIARFVSFARVPLPYYLLVPLTGFIRTPSRLAIIVLLCLSVAVAYIISSIKIRSKLLAIVLGVLVPLILLIEYHVPGDSSGLFRDTVCSQTYLNVKSNRTVTALAELPVYTGTIADYNLPYLYYSTCHFKPIFNGYSGYFPAKYGKNTKIINGFPDQKSLDKLNELKISHVVLHLDKYPGDQQEPLLEAVQKNKNLRIEFRDRDSYLIKIK